MQTINVKNVDLENLFVWIADTEGDDIYIICNEIETAAQLFIDWQYYGIASDKHVITTKTSAVITINDNDMCRYHFVTFLPTTVNSDDNAVIFTVDGDCTLAADRNKIVKAV